MVDSACDWPRQASVELSLVYWGSTYLICLFVDLFVHYKNCKSLNKICLLTWFKIYVFTLTRNIPKCVKEIKHYDFNALNLILENMLKKCLILYNFIGIKNKKTFQKFSQMCYLLSIIFNTYKILKPNRYQTHKSTRSCGGVAFSKLWSEKLKTHSLK